MKETLKVKITKKASDAAYPAIWYAGMEDKEFEVRKSTAWKNIYEVVGGNYDGKIIPFSDCIKTIK